METINLHNYEAFMLDYMEGNLSDDLTIELMDFANNHPELEIDIFDNVTDLSFVAEDLSYGDTSDLKVHEDEALFDKMVGIVEGEYSSEEVAAIEKEISEKELDKNYAYFKAAKLIPSQTEVYGNTAELKVATGRVITLNAWRYSSIAAAAVITIFALAYNFTGGANAGADKMIHGLANEKVNLTPNNADFKHTRGEVEQDVEVINTYNYTPENNLVAFEEEKKDIVIDTAANTLPILNQDSPKENNIAQENNLDKDTSSATITPSIEDDNIVFNDPGTTTKTSEPYSLFTNAMSEFINKDVAYVKEETTGGNSGTVTHRFSLGKFSFERKKSN
ncbi:MAG: hypothetical protein MK078_00695 [Crocinitomicaceae bacterium]|nr:hypothetical protein [Crocinitomicaceae bacterium]